jgi:hypothetical protein
MFIPGKTPSLEAVSIKHTKELWRETRAIDKGLQSV